MSVFISPFYYNWVFFHPANITVISLSMAFTCAFFSSQRVIATLMASRPHSATVPPGSASAMKG